VQLIVDGEHGDIKVAGTVYEADRGIRDYRQIAASRSTKYLFTIFFVSVASFLVVSVLRFYNGSAIYFAIWFAIATGAFFSLQFMDEGKPQKSEQTTHKW